MPMALRKQFAVERAVDMWPSTDRRAVGLLRITYMTTHRKTVFGNPTELEIEDGSFHGWGRAIVYFARIKPAYYSPPGMTPRHASRMRASQQRLTEGGARIFTG